MPAIDWTCMNDISQCTNSGTGRGSSTLSFYTMYLFSSQPGAVAKIENHSHWKTTHSRTTHTQLELWERFLFHSIKQALLTLQGAVTWHWALVLRQEDFSASRVGWGLPSTPLMKPVVRWELSRMPAGGKIKSHTTVSLVSSFPTLP